MMDLSTAFMEFVGSPAKLGASLSSIMFAVLILLKLRHKGLNITKKIPMIYAHIIALIFPFVLFAMTIPCQMTGFVLCEVTMIKMIAYAIMVTLPVTFVVSFFVIPRMFVYTNRSGELRDGHLFSFMRSMSRKIGMGIPRLFVVKSQKPTAFSFRSLGSAVFVSVGLLEVLSRKEAEAVLLHELAHIKRNSSLLKVSGLLFRAFSPFSLVMGFNSIGEEEKQADEFVVKMQGTGKHLVSAKRKIEEYFK